MLSRIADIIASQPNGIKQWRDHANKVFSEFHGNSLGTRKADTFAARMIGLKNANILYGIGGSETGHFESIEKIVNDLCSRQNDNAYGEGYYDFFQPVLSVKSDHGDETMADELGIFTVVYFDEECRTVEITQRLKIRVSDGDEYQEFVDALFSEEDLTPCVMPTGGSRPVVICGLSESGSKYLSDSGNGMVQQHIDELNRLIASSRLYNDAIYLTLLRCAQTLELNRIVDAAGIHPRASFMDIGLLHALYHGECRL